MVLFDFLSLLAFLPIDVSSIGVFFGDILYMRDLLSVLYILGSLADCLLWVSILFHPCFLPLIILST